MKRLKFIIPLLFLLIASPVLGATYYVDTGSTGTGDGTTTATTGANAAFKTIAEVNLKAFAAGDSCLFNRGQTWREMLTIPASGGVGNNTLFGAYGTGTLPRILGSTAIITWDQNNVSPQTADLLEEGFEATVGGANHFTTAGSGHLDNSGWTGTLGDGSALDADSTAVARPSDGGDECLLVQKVSSNFNSLASYDFGEEQGDTWTRVLIKIDADGIADAEELPVITAYDGSGIAASNRVWEIRLFQNDTGKFKYRAYIYTAGALAQQNQDGLTRTISNWTKIEVKYDHTNHAFEWRIDGASISTADITGGHKTGIQYLALGDAATSKTLTAYYDRVAISSTAYLYDTVTLPAGTWKATMSANPDAVWVVGTNEVVYWGYEETVLANVNAEYDWYLDPSGFLIVYAATTPDTLYNSVEAGTRVSCVTNNSKDYITIKDLELAYSNDNGVRVQVQDGWMVDGCTIHHIGSKNESAAEGVSFKGEDCTVQNSIFHNIGNHGVSFYVDSANGFANGLVQYCTFYDNYHSDVDMQNNGALGTFSTATVRYCYFYNTTDFDFANYGNGGIYVLADEVAPNGIDEVHIYYNVFENVTGGSIIIRGAVSNVDIFNNSIYGTLAGCTQYSAGISINSLVPETEIPTNVHIKNNIGVDTYSTCFYTLLASFIHDMDNNLWYQSAGGAAVYAQIAAVSYHSDDQAAYIAAIQTSDVDGETNCLWEDPLLFSATDFHLRLGSPCINAGVDVGLTQDYAGRRVFWGSAPEIGAYELYLLNIPFRRRR